MAKLRQRQFSRGITLVELLVVLAILSLLAAIAIPTFATLGQFVSSDAQSTARTLYSTLRAARIYASTYNVRTAVVYSLDNYAPPDTGLDDIRVPLIDSVTGNTIRAFIASATFYEPHGNKDQWFPVANEDGVFSTFPGDSVVLLNDPENVEQQLYDNKSNPRWVDADADAAEEVFGVATISANVDNKTVNFPAHVFRPRGSIDVGSSKQLFTLWVAPSPTEDISERLIDPENRTIGLAANSNLITIPIELYQATGRIRIGS